MQFRKNKYTDQQLIKMICLGGDDYYNALHYCFINWHEDAKRILLSKGNSIHNVEDSLQDAFIVFSTNIRTGKYRHMGSCLKNYFIGICKGRSYSNNRSLEKVRLTGDHKKLDQPIKVKTPDTLTEEEELTNMLNQVLRGLGKKCRDILELYRLSYSYQEIAEELNLTNANNARQKAKACRDRLKANIEKHPFLKDYFKKRNEE